MFCVCKIQGGRAARLKVLMQGSSCIIMVGIGKRNVVGVILMEEYAVVVVKSLSDRVMSEELKIECVMINDVNGYAP